MSGALQRCLEECLKLITLSVIGNRFAVVDVEISPPPARTKIGPLACYVLKVLLMNTTYFICILKKLNLSLRSFEKYQLVSGYLQKTLELGGSIPEPAIRSGDTG